MGSRRTEQAIRLDKLIGAFGAAGRRLYATGAAARTEDGDPWTAESGPLEFLVVATRAEVAGLLQLGDRRARGRGPLKVRLDIGETVRRAWFICTEPEPGRDEEELVHAALRSRSFTADAMAITPEGRLLDPFDGKADIAEGRIRTTFEPGKALREDPLRLLTLGSLVAETGLRPTASVVKAGTGAAPFLLYVSKEACLREMTRLLCAPRPRKGLLCLLETRALNMILPEVVCMVGFSESSRFHHKDLWDHTLKVVEQSPPDPAVRWAALLHDLGKVWTRTYGNKGTVHFHHHEELGAMLSSGVVHRFRMNAEMSKTVEFLVRHHLRANAYQPGWTDSAVRRLITEAGQYLDRLMDLSKADLTSGQERRRREAGRLGAELRVRIAHILEVDSRVPPLPAGIGNTIMSSFGLPPGPRIGKIKQALEAAVEAEEIAPGLEAEAYIQFLESLPELPG